MRIFKFGGASVKDAAGVKNLASIVKQSDGKLVVVVSAMGKTTNTLEQLHKYYYTNDHRKWAQLEEVRNYHMSVVKDLFESDDPVFAEIDALFFRLEDRLDKQPSLDYDYEYDQLVCFGELISTVIVNAYLQKSSVASIWKDIRFCLKTDDRWRDANINWALSEMLVKEALTFDSNTVYVTQGFIGATTTDMTTTLGREGSDYTAAILGSMLGAEKVEIWKDVPGILNADPQYFSNPVKVDFMSYREAVELTFFGAKVIHPKTIKPLQNRNIPLHVRSFIEPKSTGTLIGPEPSDDKMSKLPVFILKPKQVLITLSQPDFSFMNEENLSWVFRKLAKLGLKTNLLQHSALKLSLSIDAPERGVLDLIEQLAEQFDVRYNDGLELLTIRHYTPEAIESETKGKNIYVEQRTRRTVRFLLKAERSHEHAAKA